MLLVLVLLLLLLCCFVVYYINQSDNHINLCFLFLSGDLDMLSIETMRCQRN